MNFKREIKSSKYPIVWTPKYRKNFLRGRIKFQAEESLKHKASELKVEIKNTKVMPDHVHLELCLFQM